MRRLLIFIAILVSILLLAEFIVLAGQAQSPPAFAFPISMTTYRITAAFDLNRNTGSQADWTGWENGDPTEGNGHAYDDHTGSDTGISTGTYLYAVANGTVNDLYEDYPTDDHSGGGNYIIYSCNANAETYRINNWHLNYQGVLKNIGDPVTKSEHIANSDNTGNSTGPHLHYGISKTSGSGNYTCPYYHAWWEEDEFYYEDAYLCLTYVKNTGDPLNCRDGASTSYDMITSLPLNNVYVSSQQNGWYRIFIPMPPAKAYECRNSSGTLNPYYSETGSWFNDSAKSTVLDPAGDANYVSLSGSGTRYSAFSGIGGSDTAQFSFTTPQRGNYKVYVTYPNNANALNVTYRVNHSSGSTDVVIPQRGNYSLGGTGTHASPYNIESNPYVANHTTIGGDDTWDSYSPQGSGIPENGPERVYKFTVYTNTTVNVSVAHSGYPTLDIDIHLLGSLSNTDCLARADWSFSYALTPGTYYISCDSYGTDNSAATSYTLTVTFGENEPFANSWISLGEFSFDANTSYSTQILESSVTGKINNSLEGRVYADSIKVVPVITYRSGWSSNLYMTRVDTTTTPVCCVVVKTDNTATADSRDITNYKEIPIYANFGGVSGNNSAIVAKAVTGQRFVCTERTANGWYRVYLTNSCDATTGWISGDYLYIYHPEVVPITEIEEWWKY